MQSKLELPEISYKIHLGVGAEEQKNTQEIFVSITLIYKDAPTGCISDKIEDTIDYVDICETIADCLGSRYFHLIEYVAREIYLALKPMIPHKLQIKIRKPKPPHPLLGNGAIFYYGDED